MTRGYCYILFFLCLSEIINPIRVFGKSASSKHIIYTSSISEWTPASLGELVARCDEGSTIVFDADYDYTVDCCVRPNVSIIINGCGKMIRTINPYNYVISMFDVQKVNSFSINNLIIDGSSNASIVDKTIPEEFFITIKDVKTVSFTDCTFQNIRTDYPNWKSGDEAYTIWVENYDKFIFRDNNVINCDCPEFLKAVLPINNTNPDRFADICHNKMQFVRASSAIEVRFGRYRINNNEIGITYGSSINAYGFDSEIVGNKFGGSHNSSSIDISEHHAFNYISKNVLIENNHSEYAHDGFIMADYVYGIRVQNNTYRADIYDEETHARYDSIWSYVERSCDVALRFDHELSDIAILHNKFIGAHALMMFNTLGHKCNIRIENNFIKNVAIPQRSSLIITQIQDLKIKNNVFINTGRSLSYIDCPQFIVIGPTKTDEASERYVRRVTISNNSFSFTDHAITNAYVLAHTIYDKQQCNTLSSLDDIIIKRNKSDFDGDILLVSDDFGSIEKASISIKSNSFKFGQLFGNVTSPPFVGELNRADVLKPNTVVEKDGKRYYVILGGETSLQDKEYNDSIYIKDGSAVLRRIK